MLNIYINDHNVTAVLSGTRWDAVRFYTPKLIRKLNNQVSGCRSFGIHAPGFSVTDIKGTVFENMEMPNYYSFVAKFDDVNVTREEAIETARSNVLDEYHYDLRQQKRNLIIYLADWLGEIDDMLQTTMHEIDEEQSYSDADFIISSLDKMDDGIKKFKDGVANMSKTINNGLEKWAKNTIYGITNYNVDDLIKQAPKELQDEITKASTVVSSEDVDLGDDDDSEIEGDLVIPGSNFSTREPLTDRDEDDFTPEEEEALSGPKTSAVVGEDAHIPTASKMLDPLGLDHPDDNDDDTVDESDPDDLL